MPDAPPRPAWHTRGAARAAAILLLAAALGAGVPAALHRVQGGRVASPVGGEAWFSGRPAWLVARGFHPPEIDPAGGSLAWTTERATLSMPRLDRSRPLRLKLRGYVSRHAALRPARLRASVDGRQVLEHSLQPGGLRLLLDLPARRRAGARVELAVDPIGAREVRGETLPMGVVIQRVRLERVDGSPLPLSFRVLLLAALAAALYAAAALLTGLSAAAALLLAALAAVWHATLLMHGGAFLGSHDVCLAGLAVALVIVIGGARALGRWLPPGPGWQRALLLVAAVTAAQMAALTHPAMPPLDASFQVHNADRVAGGELLFTSATPPPAFRFPYAIALYVLALPFWGAVSDHVLLLRLITVLAEAAAALGLGLLVARWRPGAWTAAAVATLVLLAPVRGQTLAVGNLSNNFGQALLVGAITLLALSTTARLGWKSLASGGALLAVAFLSHLGVLLLGLPLAAALLFAWRAWGTVDAPAVRRLAVTVALAAAVAGVLYYAHFLDVYGAVLERLLGGAATIGEGVMAAPWTTKLLRALAQVGEGWGPGGLLLALIGTGLALARRDGLAVTWPTWLAVVAVFAVVGIWTPLEVRWLLGGAPIIAALAGLGAVSLGARGLGGRLLLGILGLVTLLSAARAALAPLVS